MLCLSSQKNKHYTKDPSDVIVAMATILSSFNAVGLSNQPQIGTGSLACMVNITKQWT